MEVKKVIKPKAAIRKQPGSTRRPLGAARAAAELPATPPKSKQEMIIGIVLLGMMVFVMTEVILLWQQKAGRQVTLSYFQSIGERGGPPEKAGKFWGPQAVRIDPVNQRLAVVDNAFQKVLLWDLVTRKHLIDIDKTVLGKAAFIPHSVAFDAAGNIGILDSNQAEISVLNKDFSLKSSWKVPGGPPVEMTMSPKGVVYCGITNGFVYGYSLEGTQLQKIRMRAPGNMVTDQNGVLYVVDGKTEKIHAFSSVGKELNAWKVRFKPFNTPVLCAWNGMIYIGEATNKRIYMYTPAGKKIAEMTHDFPISFDVGPDEHLFITGGGGIDEFVVSKPK